MGVDRITVVMQSRDPLLVGEFWAQLLGCPLAVDALDADTYAAMVTDCTALLFLPSTAWRPEANRQHLDVASVSPEHQATLVERAQVLGARLVDIGQGDVPWRVMADPEDNPFCILEPRDEYRECGPLAALVTHVKDPSTVGQFWSALVDAPVTADHSEYTRVRYTPAGPALEFVRHPNPPRGRGRLHLRVAVTDRWVGSATDSGAAVPCPVCGASSVALTDPEQNDLCVSDCPRAPEKHWTPEVPAR